MAKRNHPTRWLWWACFWILVIGLGLAYLMYYTSPSPRTITEDIRLVALLSVVGAGICVISATAQWWMRH